MDKSLWPKMAKVSNGAFFCTTELSTQGKMKWTLPNRQLRSEIGPYSFIVELLYEIFEFLEIAVTQ